MEAEGETEKSPETEQVEEEADGELKLSEASDEEEGEVLGEEEEAVENSQDAEAEGEAAASDSITDDKGGGTEDAKEEGEEIAEEDLDETQAIDTGADDEVGGDENETQLMDSKEEDSEGMEIDEEAETIEENDKQESGQVITRKRTLSQSSETEDGPKRKVGRSVGGNRSSPDGHDKYCWVCHKDGVQVNCKLCPRSYHSKCMSMDYPNAKMSQDVSYPCPECLVVMNAETIEFRSDSMKTLSLEQLQGLLKNVCMRMKQTPGVSSDIADAFIKPVDSAEAEDYFDYIVYPMDIERLERNIKNRNYGSTEGFLADAQWLVHNSIVFNSASSQYTLHAKRLLKICKQELVEIETCPECYLNAHDKVESWFVHACRRPHLLVWAKLKGFPFWPAKAMKIKDGDVDVRFFGQHDRAWVGLKDCYLYSEEMPVAPPKKSGPLLAAVEELTQHVEELKKAHGSVVFASVRTPIAPQINLEQIRIFLPEYNPPEVASKGQTQQSQAAAATPAKASLNTTNNNNNTTKVPPPPKKSPMTIRISSLKTNPTIVSVPQEEAAAGGSSEGRVTRLTRKSSASAQQNQSNLSESDQSTDEGQNPAAEAITEEKADEEVPDNTNGTDEDAPSLPKGSEILANALGGGPLRRSTRGVSRSGDGSQQGDGGTTPDKRLTRSALKGPDGGNETDESSGQNADEQPPDSVLEAMGLSKKTKETPASNKNQVKVEPLDDSDGEQINTDLIMKASNKLAEQLNSGHSTVKQNYRFNLSKDISISAVDGGDHHDEFEGQQLGTNIRIKRPNPGIQQRGVPQAIPMGVGVRPRIQGQSILNGQQPQRMNYTGQQLRQMVRNARPQHILNPRTGQTVRIAGAAAGNRPVQMMQVRNQNPHQIQKKTEDSSLNQVQGPITLPGGTITVTPLSLMNAGVPITSLDGINSTQHLAIALKNTNTSTSASTIGIINVAQQSSGGTTIVNNAGAAAAKSTKGITSVQQRRNLMASIPPSVSMHLQNLTKTMGDLVKSTVEQITLEVIEFCNNQQGKADANRLQVEVERLQNKLKQEVTDVKHNNDIALRELRITMDNEKKRAIADVKRQMEADKQKAIEEIKKKQWCASCGREALFYCCWNTSYCGYPCQEEHWPSHMASCSQSSGGNAR